MLESLCQGDPMRDLGEPEPWLPFTCQTGQTSPWPDRSLPFSPGRCLLIPSFLRDSVPSLTDQLIDIGDTYYSWAKYLPLNLNDYYGPDVWNTCHFLSREMKVQNESLEDSSDGSGFAPDASQGPCNLQYFSYHGPLSWIALIIYY